MKTHPIVETWIVSNSEGAFSEIYIETTPWGSAPVAILKTPAKESDRPKVRARAQLIASAPELARELQGLVDIICSGDRDVTIEDCDAAKAILDKAYPHFVMEKKA